MYDAYAPKLYGLLLRMLATRSDAEDLLQEVFLLAHRRLETFNGQAALAGTWLHRIAVNHALDHVRSRAVRVNSRSAPLDPDRRHGADNAIDPTSASASRIDLERALAQLPDGYRTVFVLHDVEGLEHREIAPRLGIAVWHEQLHEMLVDDGHRRGVGRVGRPKQAPAGRSHAEYVEVSLGHGDPSHLRVIDLIGVGDAPNAQGKPESSAHRQIRRERGGVHTRLTRQTPNELLEELPAVLLRGVVTLQQAHPGGEDLLRRKPKVEVGDIDHGPHHEARRHEEPTRHRDLGNHESLADPTEPHAGRTPSLVTQNLIDVGARGANGGNESRKQRRDDGQADDEEASDEIERDAHP